MAKQDKRLGDLFYDALKDIYYAENKLVKALTKMAKAAQSKDLQTAFEKHKRGRFLCVTLGDLQLRLRRAAGIRRTRR
jgi:hypothetical protein